MTRRMWVILAVAVLALMVSAPAKADGPLVVIINTPNSGLSGTPGPYATVTVTLTGSTLNLSVVGYPSFTFFGTTGGNNGMFGFNVVGSTAGLAASNLVSNLGTGAASKLIFTGAGGQMDGFGTFNQIVGDAGGPSLKTFTSFSFDLNRTGGFSSVFDVYSQSCGGENCANFVIHVAPTNGNPTGFAGDNGTQVPEPGTLALFGTGLLGIAGAIRRRLSS